MIWDEVDGVTSRAVARGLARRKPQPLQTIGIDEIDFTSPRTSATQSTGCVSK
jgi:hypothetical protein